MERRALQSLTTNHLTLQFKNIRTPNLSFLFYMIACLACSFWHKNFDTSERTSRHQYSDSFLPLLWCIVCLRSYSRTLRRRVWQQIVCWAPKVYKGPSFFAFCASDLSIWKVDPTCWVRERVQRGWRNFSISFCEIGLAFSRGLRGEERGDQSW